MWSELQAVERDRIVCGKNDTPQMPSELHAVVEIQLFAGDTEHETNHGNTSPAESSKHCRHRNLEVSCDMMEFARSRSRSRGHGIETFSKFTSHVRARVVACWLGFLNSICVNHAKMKVGWALRTPDGRCHARRIEITEPFGTMRCDAERGHSHKLFSRTGF